MKRLYTNNVEPITKQNPKDPFLEHPFTAYDHENFGQDAMIVNMQFNIAEDGYLYAVSTKPLTKQECINFIEYNNFPNDHVCITRADFNKLVKAFEESRPVGNCIEDSLIDSEAKFYERLSCTSFNKVSSIVNDHYDPDEPLIILKQQVVSDTDLRVLLDCIGNSIDRGDIEDFTSNLEEVIEAYNHIKHYLT